MTSAGSEVSGEKDTARVARAAGVIGAATLLSRVLGLVREIVVTRAFGATHAADAFFVAFRIPNLLRELLAEGSMSAAFVPVFSEYLTKRSRAEAVDLAHAVFTVLLILLSSATILGIAAAPWIVRVIAPGFGVEDKFDLTVTLARVMFPFLIFIGFAALAMGILNALRRFTVPALAPAVLNVGVISGVLFLPPYVDPPILGLAIGELIGGLLQFAIQIPPLLKEKIAFRLRWRPSDPGLAQIRRLFLAFLVGAGALQINNFVLTILASYLAAGSVSYLYYGMRLIHLPLGVFGVAMATAILPALSVQATHGEVGRLRETFASGMSLVLLITVPAAVGLVSFAGPIVSTIFMRGAFDAAAVHGTALAVMAYAVGLWAFAAVRVAVSAFYSMQETRVPVAGTLVTVAANLILSLLLMGPLKHAGLALATALAAVLNLGFLLYFLRRRIETVGGRRIAGAFLKAAAGSVPIGLVGVFLSRNALWLMDGRLGEKAVWLALGIGAGLVSYGVILRVIAPEEWSRARRIVRRSG